MDNEQLLMQLGKFDFLARTPGLASRVPVERDDLRRLLADSDELASLRARIAGAAVGILAEYEHANDRATFLYFNGSGAVETGGEYAMLRLPVGEGE